MREIKFFDEKTKKFYKLVKTNTWPTLEISGIHMHRIKGVDPKKDTELKIKSLGKLYGNVLDTCMGLGYTAVVASKFKKVKMVITIEKDKNVVWIAKQNFYSKEVFSNKKIKVLIGDSFLLIKTFPSSFFDFIIHDPPRISIAEELYSLEFYKEMFRVLKSKGKIFHYVGYPGKKQGKNYLRGILRRLRNAGFSKIEKIEEALGLIIRK
ncbi:MAG: hypothetical protein B6U78_00895 [Candidatus Aenigmarchaeota archaeon ex4484_224]|nr:MAG: hypothetical protein B6U78_00895 [Candidatus Aenigmarchaeota archaeon ex4484_224]